MSLYSQHVTMHHLQLFIKYLCALCSLILIIIFLFYVSGQVDLTELKNSMRDYQKTSAKQELKQEMMDDVMGEVFDGDQDQEDELVIYDQNRNDCFQFTWSTKMYRQNMNLP